MRTDQAKAIPLEQLLEPLGHVPRHTKGQDLWYTSPFRQESQPSFKVNTAFNSWYDFGLGKGGNILDFVMVYFQVSGIPDALAELDRIAGIQRARSPLPLFPAETSPEPVAPPLPAAPQEPAATPGIHLKKVQPLQNTALIRYLETRAIPVAVARPFVQEAYYTVPGRDRTYFALAFANDSGGHELRNPYFKGVAGSKDISRLDGRDTGTVAVFEGFMDFLSWLAHGRTPHPPCPALVLNSTALKDRAVEVIRQTNVQAVHLYLDQDDTGRRLTGDMQAALSDMPVMNKSGLYKGYEDFNAFLAGMRQTEKQL